MKTVVYGLLACILAPWAILHLVLLGIVIAALGGGSEAMEILSAFLDDVVS